MLIIRQEQMKALAHAARLKFIARGIEHVKQLLPERYRELGAERVRESVVRALEKAGRYGLTQEYDVLRLLNCMYVFGFDFDTDSRYIWAAEILNEQIESESKMNKLMRGAEGIAPPVF